MEARSPASPPREWQTAPWAWPLLIALLAIAASLSGITNQYAQDDIAIIQTNPLLHDLRGIGRVFTEPYWPPPFVPSTYRPLSSGWYALQWLRGGGSPVAFRLVGFLLFAVSAGAVVPSPYPPLSSVWYALQWLGGGGSPVAFRLVSSLLYAVTAVAVFRLARTRLPVIAAAACAALFAVHPVHVEAVAMAVNQSELWIGLLGCIATGLYVRERSAGGPLPVRTELSLAGLYLAACLFKETGLILPGLLKRH